MAAGASELPGWTLRAYFPYKGPCDVSGAQGGGEHILIAVLGLGGPETNMSHSPPVSCSSGLEERQTNTTFTLRVNVGGEAVPGHKCEFCKLSLGPFFLGSSPLLLQLSVVPVSSPFLPSILPGEGSGGGLDIHLEADFLAVDPNSHCHRSPAWP